MLKQFYSYLYGKELKIHGHKNMQMNIYSSDMIAENRNKQNIDQR